VVSTFQPRDVGDLRKLELRGDCPDFLFFWGHRPRRDGGIGPGCLSQWWPAPFRVGGVTYPTAEHFMMAGKARLFGDEVMAWRIIEAASPGDAKALGQAIRGYDEELWASSRYGIVVEGNIAKFGQHQDLLAYLAATAGRVLVEASPADRVWGIGLAADDSRADRPSQWEGLNLLGFALMDVRERLAGETPVSS
jgi:ribA/ribD-fused uncharacterized protein